MERLRLEQGDIVVLDNLRVAHGRTTYQGERLLGLLLSDMIGREAHRVPPTAFQVGREAAAVQRASAPRRHATADGLASADQTPHCGAKM